MRAGAGREDHGGSPAERPVELRVQCHLERARPGPDAARARPHARPAADTDVRLPSPVSGWRRSSGAPQFGSPGDYARDQRSCVDLGRHQVGEDLTGRSAPTNETLEVSDREQRPNERREQSVAVIAIRRRARTRIGPASHVAASASLPQPGLAPPLAPAFSLAKNDPSPRVARNAFANSFSSSYSAGIGTSGCSSRARACSQKGCVARWSPRRSC